MIDTAGGNRVSLGFIAPAEVHIRQGELPGDAWRGGWAFPTPTDETEVRR